MSGGHFDYYQWHIREIADSIEEEIENQKKPEPPTKKVHYVNIKKQLGEGCYRYINHDFDTLEGAKRYLASTYVIKDGRFFDKYDTYTDKDGKEVPSEYIASESYCDEYEEGHEDCYYGVRFSKETIEEFKKAVYYLRIAGVYAQRVDWLLSGDDGENNFHERLKEELKQL